MAVTWRAAVGSDMFLRHGEQPEQGRGWRPTHWQPLPDPPK